ncbi:MAG TPA: hypothetical protein VKC61_20755 [Pyrinomonadaceae bacterium]|nr:hypothetical protein [Pyrinomonadaceae bacterium]
MSKILLPDGRRYVPDFIAIEGYLIDLDLKDQAQRQMLGLDLRRAISV